MSDDKKVVDLRTKYDERIQKKMRRMSTRGVEYQVVETGYTNAPLKEDKFDSEKNPVYLIKYDTDDIITSIERVTEYPPIYAENTSSLVGGTVYINGAYEHEIRLVGCSTISVGLDADEGEIYCAFKEEILDLSQVIGFEISW